MPFGTISNLTSGTSASATPSTASVTVKNNAAAYLAMAVSTNPTTTITQNVPTGLGLTWVLVASIPYRVRRALYVYRAVNTSGSDQTGTIALAVTSANTEQVAWSVDQFEGVDTANPDDDPVTGENTGTGNSLALADVGTPDSGDRVYCAFGLEEAGTTGALEGAFTALGTVQSGTGVRQLLTGYDAADPQDETPSATWSSGSNGAGGVAFIVNAGAGGGGDPPPAVTDVDTDETIRSDQTNVVVTGTDFATATVELRQTGVVVAQSIDSQNATTIQIDVVILGATDVKFGAADLAVINGDAQEDTIPVTVTPPTGEIYVTVGTPNATAPNRITAVADLVSGDQVWARAVGGGPAPTGLTINADLTWYFTTGNTPQPFEVAGYDNADKSWGAFATQSIAGGSNPNILVMNRRQVFVTRTVVQH